MPELSDEQIRKIDETHDTVITIKTVLLGVNGDTGLVGLVKQNGDDLKVLSNDHARLKRNFFILLSFLAGSGVITGTLLGLIH